MFVAIIVAWAQQWCAPFPSHLKMWTTPLYLPRSLTAQLSWGPQLGKRRCSGGWGRAFTATAWQPHFIYHLDWWQQAMVTERVPIPLSRWQEDTTNNLMKVQWWNKSSILKTITFFSFPSFTIASESCRMNIEKWITLSGKETMSHLRCSLKVG